MGVRFSHPQPENRSLNWLRYFRGIAQLVARLVRDEEAVGSNPAAPTKTAETAEKLLQRFFVVSKTFPGAAGRPENLAVRAGNLYLRKNFTIIRNIRL